MSGLVAYDNSDEGSSGDESLVPPIDPKQFASKNNLASLDAAPLVDGTMVKSANQSSRIINLDKTKELTYNPRYEDLYAPVVGPVNPAKADQPTKKNFLTGNLEPAFVSAATFELERKNFQSYGSASNPSDGSLVGSLVTKPTQATEPLADIADPESVADAGGKQKKRKRAKNMDSGDVDGYTGPWAEFENEIKVSASFNNLININ